ncbi:MAG: hypothetical protein ACPGQF_08085, partial [Akkermansiaceae bacterium]
LGALKFFRSTEPAVAEVGREKDLLGKDLSAQSTTSESSATAEDDVPVADPTANITPSKTFTPRPNLIDQQSAFGERSNKPVLANVRLSKPLGGMRQSWGLRHSMITPSGDFSSIYQQDRAFRLEKASLPPVQIATNIPGRHKIYAGTGSGLAALASVDDSGFNVVIADLQIAETICSIALPLHSIDFKRIQFEAGCFNTEGSRFTFIVSSWGAELKTKQRTAYLLDLKQENLEESLILSEESVQVGPRGEEIGRIDLLTYEYDTDNLLFSYKNLSGGRVFRHLINRGGVFELDSRKQTIQTDPLLVYYYPENPRNTKGDHRVLYCDTQKLFVDSTRSATEFSFQGSNVKVDEHAGLMALTSDGKIGAYRAEPKVHKEYSFAGLNTFQKPEVTRLEVEALRIVSLENPDRERLIHLNPKEAYRLRCEDLGTENRWMDFLLHSYTSSRYLKQARICRSDDGRLRINFVGLNETLIDQYTATIDFPREITSKDKPDISSVSRAPLQVP